MKTANLRYGDYGADHVIEALAAQGADDAFHVGTLPWRSRRGEHVQVSTTPIASERRYAMVRVARRGETITLSTLPDVSVREDDLLPPQA